MRNFLDHSRNIIQRKWQVPCFHCKLCALLRNLSTESLNHETKLNYYARHCKFQLHEQSDRKEDMLQDSKASFVFQSVSAFLVCRLELTFHQQSFSCV